jgi:hypothetical protein
MIVENRNVSDAQPMALSAFWPTSSNFLLISLWRFSLVGGGGSQWLLVQESSSITSLENLVKQVEVSCGSIQNGAYPQISGLTVEHYFCGGLMSWKMREGSESSPASKYKEQRQEQRPRNFRNFNNNLITNEAAQMAPNS